MGKFDKLFENCVGFNDVAEEGKDFYVKNGCRVMTEKYLVERGWCCSNGCIHCPYWPKAQKGNTILRKGIDRN